MQKYTFINNAGLFANYQSLIFWLYNLLSKQEIFKFVTLDFEGKTLYFKTTIKEKDLAINIFVLPTTYKVEVSNKKTKEIINTILYNYTNFTELDMVTIFAKKVMPAIKMIVGPTNETQA